MGDEHQSVSRDLERMAEEFKQAKTEKDKRLINERAIGYLESLNLGDNIASHYLQYFHHIKRRLI